MKVAVVTRQLPDKEKAVSAVITAKQYQEHEDLDVLLQAGADRHIQNFKKQFAEFEFAEWKVEFIVATES